MDWFTTKIASTTKGLPHDHAIAPHLASATPPPSSPDATGPSPARPSRPGAADRPSTSTPARSSGGCNRRPPPRPRPRSPVPAPAAVLDEPTRRRLAVTAFAMGVSTRQIEDLLRVILARGRPRPLDHRPLGRRRGREGRAASWRRSTRRASPGSGRSPSTRSFLGATDPGRDRAGEHDRRLLPQRRRPQGRDLGEATGAVRPPGVRRLRRRQGDRRGGRATSPRPAATTRRPRPWSTAWTSSTPRWRPTASWPGTGGAPRRPGSRPRPPTSRSPTRSGKASTRGAWPRPPAPPGARRSRRSSGPSGSESAWGRARAALDLFGPDGRLNDRARAEAEIAAALKDLTGPDWSKVRNFLNDPRSLAFLDRMHRRLESAEPRPRVA